MPQFRMFFLPVFVLCSIVVSCLAENSTLPDPEKQPEHYANKWLVITATETEKEKCACERGVVLNTDNYGNLKDGLFVCVAGVAQTQKSASQIQDGLSLENYIKKSGEYKPVDLIKTTIKGSTSKSSIHTPCLIKRLSFSDKSSSEVPKKNDFDINKNLSGTLETFYDSTVENSIISIKITFINKSSNKNSSTMVKIESNDPLFYIPQVKVYSLQEDKYLFSFEYSDNYFPYLNVVVINENTQIEYSGKYEDYRMVDVELKDSLPAVKLTQSLDTIHLVWENKSFNRKQRKTCPRSKAH